MSRNDPEVRDRATTPGAPWGLTGTVIGVGLAFLLQSIVVAIAGPLVAVEPAAESSAFGLYATLFALQLVLVAVPIGIALYFSAGPFALGLRPYSWRALAEAALLGGGLILATWLYSALLEFFSPAAHTAFHRDQVAQLELLGNSRPLILLLAIVAAPLGEEMFFRGFFFGGIRARLGFAWASGVSAALFAVAHWPLWWSLPPIFVVGLALAWIFERHRSLAACMFAHAVFNAVALWLGPI